MPRIVGPRGQVVIEKEIRDRLGIGAGWKTIQRVVGAGRVELRFIPPTHSRSLAGVFSAYARPEGPPTPAEMDEAVAAGIADEWVAQEVESVPTGESAVRRPGS